MSITPALLAIQMSTSAITNATCSHAPGHAPSVGGKPRRGLLDLGANAVGWRRVCCKVAIVLGSLAGLCLLALTILACIVGFTLASMTLSPWAMLITIPLTFAVMAGAGWLLVRMMLG